MEIETYTHCTVCGQSHHLMAEVLGLCPDCARSEAGIPQARIAHTRSHWQSASTGTRLFKLD